METNAPRNPFLFDTYNTKDTKNTGLKQVEANIPIEALSQDFTFHQKYFTELDKPPINPESKFPLDSLPLSLQETINEFHRAYQLPIDFYGLGVLVTCASVIGNSYCLEYKKGYRIPCIFYAAIVGNSSIGKTPVLKRCLKPIWDIEAKYESQYKKELDEWRKSSIDKSNTSFPKPERKDMLLNNATVEAIHIALSNNPKGVILLQDELIAWINSLNQYRNGSDTEFWLSNWSNTGAKVNRASKETLFIPKPSISVIGGLQPSVIKDFAGKGRKDNGFFYRVLFAYPDNVIKPYESNYVPDESIFEGYNDFVFKLDALPNKIQKTEEGDWNIESIPLFLDEVAFAAYVDWKNKNTDLINESQEDSIKSLFGKLEEYCLRFTLVLHILEAVSKNLDISITIDKTSVEKAINLTEYFRDSGLKVLNELELSTDPLSKHPLKKQHLYDNLLPEIFKTGDGIEIAKSIGIKKRTFKRFLSDKELFRRIEHGLYEKIL